MAGRRPLAAGNWKMNGLKASASEIEDLIARLDSKPADACDVMICPPATLIAAFAALTEGTPVALGGQDCSPYEKGAHTGDLSAKMLKDAGATAVIVGHSERRQDHGETDEVVLAKAEAVQAADLIAIVCVGETEAERDAGKTIEVVSRQLEGSLPTGSRADNTVVAYEPVWAIGTGRTPTVEDVAAVHDALRERLTKRYGGEVAGGIRLLYGGSVKPSNARELMAVENVDGALVGGASLKAEDFDGIIDAYR